MKVYFTNSFLEGCWYVRSYLPMVAGGWDGDRHSLYQPQVKATTARDAMMQSDIIVAHRPNDEIHFEIAQNLQKLGKKVVFENDDTFKDPEDKMILGDRLEYVSGWLDKFLGIADMATCTTEYLAKEYRELNKNVVVLPNCVDPDDWTDEPQKNESDKVRIGLVGSVALNDDYHDFRTILQELDKRNDVTVVLFSLPPKGNERTDEIYKDDFAFWDNLKNVEWQPFVYMKDYIDTLDNLKLDIMAIPRKDDYFNRCKSNLKFLEASMLEIPTVAQGFPDGMSPYEVDPDDAKHMIIVKDNSKWMEELDKLISNAKLRKEMGLTAKQYVVDKYDIYHNIWRWEEAYAKLLS